MIIPKVGDKVFLANKAWNGEYLELVEQSVALFYKREDAENFCVDRFIEEGTKRCISNSKIPDIYKRELEFAINNRQEFISKNILFYTIENPEDTTYSGQYFTIIEMEIK